MKKMFVCIPSLLVAIVEENESVNVWDSTRCTVSCTVTCSPFRRFPGFYRLQGVESLAFVFIRTIQCQLIPKLTLNINKVVNNSTLNYQKLLRLSCGGP